MKYPKLVLCLWLYYLKIVFANKPNIVIILADDLGWNDVGFHGSNEIPTPNIDALAYNGIVLNKHYVLPVCSPSRSALMTGKYPIRTGLQGDPSRAQQPIGLPLSEKILPQFLKEQGYKTHLLGKWHLGFHEKAYTPTKRGFDSHFGYFNGWIRYNDSVFSSHPFIGIDARRNFQPAGNEFEGKYATDVFTNEAVNIIKNHDQRNPLFLEISQPAVHAVKSDLLQVRNEEQNDKDFEYIKDKNRRLFAGVLQALDETVGKVVEALSETNMLDNSVILFMSDNGGATEDPSWHFRNFASNWPLRGMKTSLYEGGVRGAAAIWSPLFKKRSYVSGQLFHISDWLPTFVAAAGGDLEDVKDIDGVNQWNLLVGDTNITNRQEILVNINDRRNSSAIIYNKWKLISNNETYQPTFADNYAGVTGREPGFSYNLTAALTSTTNRLISGSVGWQDMGEVFSRVRSEAIIDSKCESRILNVSGGIVATPCKSDCLYELENDPCEVYDVAEQNPEVVDNLKNRLMYYRSVSVPQIRAEVDPRANPVNWDSYWSPWLDDKDKDENEIGNTSSAIIEGVLIISVTFLVCKRIGAFLTAVV